MALPLAISRNEREDLEQEQQKLAQNLAEHNHPAYAERRHRHDKRDILDLDIPLFLTLQDFKTAHRKLEPPDVHDPKPHGHEAHTSRFAEEEHRHKASELDELVKPEQIRFKGLNADTVDGKHAQEIIDEVEKKIPKKVVERWMGGGGGGAKPSLTYVTKDDETDALPNSEQHNSLSGSELHNPKSHGADKHDHTCWYAAITPLGAILPDSNAPAQTKVTGTNFTYYVLDFDKATAESIFAQFKLPPNYSPGDTLEIIIQWISTVTSGDVKWGAQILGRTDAEAFDASMSSEDTVTTTTDGTAGNVNTSTIQISSPSLAAEDVFILKVRRVADDAADTMDADARIIMIGVEL